MAEITINGVKYTNVPNKKAGTKFAASLTQSNIGASQAVQDYVNSAYFYPLVNAIDINWNGVEVDENSYINTTSDLISYIASKESNIDLSSYATMTYVDQKITDLIGGAPETLDTLKELADALADDASLAYVTQALDGKADKSSLTNYATNSYVTTELDKKANKSEIPSMPDLTPYVSYEQANSYYAYKSDIPDMTQYVSVSSYNALVARVEELAGWIVSYHIPTPTGIFAFEWADMNMNVGNVITPPITNTYEYSNITYLSSDNNIFMVWGNGECLAVNSGNATLTASLLDNSNNVVTTASLAVIVAGSSEYDFSFDDEYISMNIGDTVTPSITNTSEYTNISYTSSDSSVVSVDANGTCTALTLGQATISATLYDNNNNEQASSSVQLNVNKFTPVAYWSFNGTALPDNEMVVLPYDTLTQSTYTFYSDPATGWSVGDTLYETPGITIDNSTYVITVDPTSFEHAGKGRAQVDYNEDATYQQKSYSIEFKILAQGADPQFFFADDNVTMSQNSTQTEVQLYDLTGFTEQGYTPTFTIGNSSYVSVAPRQDATNIIQFTWLAEGETTVTATITDGNNTHSTTINVHCQWDRDWTDGHVYTSQNNEVNYEYGIVKNGSNPSLTFTASNGNTQDPMNGDLFEVSIPNDTYNIVSYTSTSSGLTISFDTSAAANASAGDEINMTIIKQQDTTYGYYTKDLRFKVVHAGNDPLLWWNGDTFTVTENDVFSQDPITNWLGNQIIDFSTWQPLTPTISFDSEPGNIAHVDQDNVLHGDNEGYVQMHATVTDLNNNAHYASATVHVEAATFSNASVYYNNDPNQGQGFLDTNPYEIGLSNTGLQVDISFEGPEYNTNNASNDFSIVYDTNFSTPKAMDATISSGLTNTYSSGVNHIQFDLSLDNVTMSTAGEQNRFILTFGHGGTNYLTDYIKFEFNGQDS